MKDSEIQAALEDYMETVNERKNLAWSDFVKSPGSSSVE